MTMESPDVKILMFIMSHIETRAKQQGKAKYLGPILDTMLGPMAECSRAATVPPTEENPMPITVDALFHLHAGMVALIRLTGSDDLMSYIRPNMLSHAEDPEFRRAIAIECIQEGAPHVSMTPELYGKLLDVFADSILRKAGAA